MAQKIDRDTAEPLPTPCLLLCNKIDKVPHGPKYEDPLDPEGPRLASSFGPTDLYREVSARRKQGTSEVRFHAVQRGAALKSGCRRSPF